MNILPQSTPELICPNQRLNVNLLGLKSRGERADKLITNLFDSYHYASDTELSRYIKLKSTSITKDNK